MVLLYITENGYKIAYGEGTADNSAGTAAADIDVEITVGELEQIINYLAVTVLGSASYVKSVSISGNKATVTVNVPAGATATVRLLVIGY